MPGKTLDAFGTKSTLSLPEGKVSYYRLKTLEEKGVGTVSRLPFTIRILLEALLRTQDDFIVTEEHIRSLANWNAASPEKSELPFKPARVILQDFTGVPAVVDLAALRSAMNRLGGDPTKINPLVPVDLVIDHSVQVDQFGSKFALMYNAEKEFERNRERYEFLRWGAKAFDNFRVVPPATGIVHQVNLEYLAKVVQVMDQDGEMTALPDTLVGTDSHTTMINGLGVVGWGVGGIEAEAVMLGQPIYMLQPEVVGMKLTGKLAEGATATDLVLKVTEMLRAHGVVGKFVEFYGPGLANLTLPDRATISNMAPEYGATVGFFPVDDETLRYMRFTGRTDAEVARVEAYCKENMLWRDDAAADADYSHQLELDLAGVEVALAGPKRPQDRVALKSMKKSFNESLTAPIKERGFELSPTQLDATGTYKNNGDTATLKHGSLVIAAITSCTNTSNPSVLIGAGLLAKKAVEAGLSAKPWVKTSLAPGSKVVTDYLDKAGLTEYLEKVNFHTVGYGCTTCIGNSGPLPEEVVSAIQEGDLVAAAVLSGNRNFEGRVNPHTRANYLASPPLVVAYALAGRVDIDFDSEPIGVGANGPVYLKDIWPTNSEVKQAIHDFLDPEMFRHQYGNVWDSNEEWNKIQSGDSAIYDWDPKSTYIQEPPFFVDLTVDVQPIQPIKQARCLALLGDSVTTDHISPAGNIARTSPAASYLNENGVEWKEFNSYGSRRGNDRVMVRGTFANIRLKNQLAPGTEGGFTRYQPADQEMTIYDASLKYKEQGTPLVIFAGKEYGTGSSRDWAAKGTYLLGVRAVVAQSYERIHRSNLVGMGVLPLQFKEGDSWTSLGISGKETYSLNGLDDNLKPGQEVELVVTAEDGTMKTVPLLVRLDTPVELQYYRNGGILQTVLRQLNA
ncbi:aconitate hydratase AcnA [bacterium]|nr:aconitate hydratase AcnA [bacterium]